MNENNPLPILERLPRSAGVAKAVVILLHGRAAKAETIFSIQGLLDPDFHIIAIGAPYECELGGFEWFLPYDKEHPLESFTVDMFSESEAMLSSAIERLISEKEITSEKLFIGGFSQGAAMSHILAMRGRIRTAGILPMSGFFPRPLTKWDMPKVMPKFLITHGSRDEILPVSESKVAYDFYIEKQVEAEFYEYNGRHKMTIPLIKKINEWILSSNDL